MTHPRPALRWLRELSTRRALAAALPVADDPVVRADAEAIAATIRPLLGEPEPTPDQPAFTGRPVVPPMPTWKPGSPFGMARWER